MPNTTQCPSCGQQYDITPEYAGKRVECGCGAEFTIPDIQKKTPPLIDASGGALSFCAVNQDIQMEYYYAEGTQQQGPVTEKKLVEMIETKQISAMTKIWCEEYESWIEFSASPMARYALQGGTPAVTVRANHHNIQPQIVQQGCYCRSCGNAVMPNAQVCMSCGTPPQLGSNFCPTCASPTNPHQVMCVKCGVPLNAQSTGTPVKNKILAGMLAFGSGLFGVHNFYLGYIGKAVAQLLLTLSLWGMIISWPWAIIEAILILTGTIKTDAQGNPLK